MQASNYFVNNGSSANITNVPHFSRVKYAGVYPGVDLVYYGNQNRLEYDLVLAPGADHGRIKIAFDGADEMHIDSKGDLVLHTAAGEMRQLRPILYQEIQGVRIPVEGSYVLLGERLVGMQVAAYDPARPLVIDPVFSYSTFLGGKGGDAGTAITVDGAGNAYVAGWTFSTDFPLINPYDSRIGASDEDVFVSKLNATGTGLLYSTYIGGAKSSDYATGIAIDAAGNAYVTGSTSGNDFPTTTTAYQKAPASGGGAFVAKFGPAGNTLIYSTYLLNASNTRIAVDNLGNSYITGQAGAGFATTAGAFQTAIRTASGNAPFALKLNPTGSGLGYATVIGGSGIDTAKAMALDSNGSVYLAGSTTSANFPTVNAFQPTHGGGLDGFVTKLNAAGSGLIYSTYLGGVLDDTVNAMAVGAAGNVYVAGETYSANFPVKNAFQPKKAGFHLTNASLGNAFVTKLAPAGDAILYSSFLGGEVCYQSYCSAGFGATQFKGDAAYGIAVDLQGHAYITGLVHSYTFPLVDSLLGYKQQDNYDSLFVSKVSLGGSVLVYSSIIHTDFSSTSQSVTGAPFGAGQAIAVDVTGAAYLIANGFADFPTTAGAFQATSLGGDAAVFKLSSGMASLTLNSSSATATAGQEVTLTVNITGAATNGSVLFYDGPYSFGSAVVTNGTAVIKTTFSTGIHFLSAVYRNANSEADAAPVMQVVNPPPVCN